MGAHLDPDDVARRLGVIAIEAGWLLAAHPDRTSGIRFKGDGSPSSAADLLSEELILARLGAAFPAIPVVAEESATHAPPGDLFFLVDPLDGTRDYVSGAGEFSVNIALVAGRRPVAAAVAAPAGRHAWIAGTRALVAEGLVLGAEPAWQPARVRPAPAAGLVSLESRRHGDAATEACLAALPIAEHRTASSAVKFCLIASGEADIYLRCGPTMEWDTAAGDHVLSLAGGIVIGPDRRPLTYGHHESGFLNGTFAALGDRTLVAQIDLPGRPGPDQP